jgi:hypothetical protein
MTEMQIAERLLAAFNRGNADDLASLCEPRLRVNSQLLGLSRSANALVGSPLTALIASCHARFPGIAFSPHETDCLPDSLVMSWHGEFRSPESRRTVVVPCRVRVNFAARMIRELWFEADLYGVLRQLGRICAEPGVADSVSESINEAGLAAFTQALLEPVAAAPPFCAETVVRAYFELYRNVNESVDTEVARVEGAAKIDPLLRLIRHRLLGPLELSFRAGISQGSTTTFRGSLRGTVAGLRQRYPIICCFVSRQGVLRECRVRVAPPATLMECLR